MLRLARLKHNLLDKYKKKMKRAIRAVIYSAFLTTISVVAFFILPAKVQYHVTEKYAFSANQMGKKIKLAVMLPKDNAYQAIDNLEIRWGGDISGADYEEVKVIKLSGHSDHGEAILDYDVNLFQGRIDWEGNATLQDIHPQKGIESNESVLIKKARELTAGHLDDAAQESYKFTAAYLSWPKGTRIGEEPSALIAYENRIGVCGDFANLMTALNRSINSPARSISGLSMPTYLPPKMTIERIWMHPGGAHAWVEVYDQGHWTIADPSWASRMPFDGIWFGRSMGQYLSYGETGAHEQIYEEMLQWGEESGELIGAMSAPLKFVSSSEDNNHVVITPVVRVKKGRDARWVFAVSSFLVILAASAFTEYHIVNRGKSKDAE